MPDFLTLYILSAVIFFTLGVRNVFKKEEVGNIVVAPGVKRKLWRFLRTLLIFPWLSFYYIKDDLYIDIIGLLFFSLLTGFNYGDFRESIKDVKLALGDSNPEIFKEYEIEKRKNFRVATLGLGIMIIAWLIALIYNLTK